MRLGMAVDLERCIGCRTCTVACKAENSTPQEVFWMFVFQRERGRYPHVTGEFLPRPCMHCDDPPCAKVCPVNAIDRREKDGVVLIDYDRCIGCRYCIQACPYGANYYNLRPYLERAYFRWGEEGKGVYGEGDPASEAGATPPYYNPGHTEKVEGDGRRSFSSGGVAYHGVVTKCTFCVHRLEKGLEPACVKACPVSALLFGDLDDPASGVARAVAGRGHYRLKEGLGTRPKVIYLSRREG